MRDFVPSVMERIEAMYRRRTGLTPKQEKKVKAPRKKRARRGQPVRHLDMIPADATPKQRHEIEMRERAKRRDERSHRSELYRRNADPVPEKRRSTTNVNRTKAAAEKRERRRMRNMILAESRATGNERARVDLKNGETWMPSHPGSPYGGRVDLDWTKKRAGR